MSETGHCNTDCIETDDSYSDLNFFRHSDESHLGGVRTEKEGMASRGANGLIGGRIADKSDAAF